MDSKDDPVKSVSDLDVGTIVVALDDMYDDGDIDPIYQAKARVLNQAIQEIGMGRYQIYLFFCAGFGWFADSVWPLIGGLILSPVVTEFHFDGPFLTMAINIGLMVGAIIWSLGCDIWGRRWSFNSTLLIAGVFGLAAGGSPNFLTLASLLAVVGFGVGGNMPVDSAVFLDMVPGTHQFLLTVLSVWWCLGQLLISLIAWPLIANFSCDTGSTTCEKRDNMGWRYLMFTLGGITLLLWGIRFFVFNLVESPRFLISRGRDEEAVKVIHQIAQFSSRETSLTVDKLNEAAQSVTQSTDIGKPTSKQAIRSGFALGIQNIKGLFKTRKVAFSTSILIVLWAIIGLASTLYSSFLPFLLTSRGATFGDATIYIAYRNQVILSVIGVPGAFLAGWAVEVPYVGRKGTLAISAGLTGAFLFASTTARSSSALLGWNCGYVFNSNIMYGVLYAISPEIFPAKYRGTGNGLVSTATRILGVIAPVIALYANLETAVPVYIAGALTLFAGVLALFVPYEPRGKASI